jgi:hypothetical protein
MLWKSRKKKTKTPRKPKKVIQLVVERHHVNTNDPQYISQVHYKNEARTVGFLYPRYRGTSVMAQSHNPARDTPGLPVAVPEGF